MLSTLVNEEKDFVDKATYKLLCEHTQKSQKALKNDLAKINKTILSLIREDEQLSKLFEEIVSVPGVGQVTATEMIVAMCGSRLKPVVRLNSKTFLLLNN